jgi:hypothetical protein
MSKEMKKQQGKIDQVAEGLDRNTKISAENNQKIRILNE